MDIINFIKKELEDNIEIEYKKFSSSITPNANVLGVKIPKLRKLAKIISKDDWEYYLKYGSENYMEEIMLKGFIISNLKLPKEKLFELVKYFVPKIDNWAVCDTFCSGLKFFKKEKYALDFLLPYLKSKEEFKLRFGVVSLFSYFADFENIDFVLNTLFNLKSDKYYAQMAIAWGISICYTKFPDKTLKKLLNNNLEDFIFNKSISKICDSFRVSKEDKTKLKLLKR